MSRFLGALRVVWGRVRAFLVANPVRVRSAVVAALTLVGVAVPSLAGIETNEVVVGLVLAGVTVVLGQGASTRVARLYESREDAPR